MTKVKKFYVESELVFEEKPRNKQFNDLEGQKFGRLTALGFAGDRKWYCKCDCGNIKMIQSNHLKSIAITSCGCFHVECTAKANTTHGHSKEYSPTKTYTTWVSMLARCFNPNSCFYHNYGGRGITVCERWLKFENFLEDMGEKPKGLTIERKENDGNYCKENCRWATDKEQANNRRSNHFLTFNRKTQTIAQWAEEIGIKGVTIWSRINKYGWSVEKALSEPISRT